ncbi:serine dehydratase, partial [Sphingomonas sanguinis]
MTLPVTPATAPATMLPRSEDSVAAVSVTELFTIGIGPSSSHTVGPMRAAKAFATEMLDTGLVPDRVQAELFGSLSLTGRGHHSDRAVLLGLAGETPETVDPDAIEAMLA